MLRLQAESFYGVTSAMHSLREKIESGKLRSVSEQQDGGIFISFEKCPVLVEHLRAEALELAVNLRVLGAKLSLMSAVKLDKEISGENGFTWESVRNRWDEVHFRLLDELKSAKVYVLNDREAEFFDPPTPLFGDQFAARFPSEGMFELDEAAKCMGLARPTAAVFHLMRLMEIGIKSIAECLQTSNPVRPAERNWTFILKGVKAAIDTKWPTQSERMSGDGQVFDELYVSLDAVKHPWRNATMHVDKKYTDDEAEHVFVAVRGFMKRLATRCDENGEPKVQ